VSDIGVSNIRYWHILANSVGRKGVQRRFTYFSPSVKLPGRTLAANVKGRHNKEFAMDIVYAAEKPSIATLLSEHIRRRVRPDEIRVSENPDETGSFFIGFNLDHYVLSPNGEIAPDRLRCQR
jgi:hypothetical protein